MVWYTRATRMPSAELPNRSLFKAPEVCEIAQVQPYVLRSWEAEFPDLGVTRAGTRVYRRGDVERVLRLKHLLFVEGLTLAGARRRLEEESTPIPEDDEPAAPPAGRGAAAGRAEAALRRHLTELRQGLRALLEMLETAKASPATFELRPGAAEGQTGRAAKAVKSRKARRTG